MYSYMDISTYIEIHDVCLAIRVSHRDLCHCIGIHDSALGHGGDAMSSHMPPGPFISIVLVQLDISLQNCRLGKARPNP
jgi:hypothetical protein